MNRTVFQRVTDRPLLGLEAVPWAAPAPVVKGSPVPGEQREVRATIMHPSIIEAARFCERAPARYLMYYAPHHSPGIGAAGADRITGPWTPLRENPVLRLDQCGGFTGHISAPDVVWSPEDKRFFMYFHGSVARAGQQTGVAASDDGVHFKPLAPGPVLPCPYLRVWRHGGLWYGIVRLGNNLGLARSPDGIKWELRPACPLLECGQEHGEYDRLRHHCVHLVGDALHLYYCTYRDPDLRVEAIRSAIVRLEGDWTQWRAERIGDVLRPALDWERSNLRDPYIIEADGRLYMFYVGGNEAGIGVAVRTH